MRGIWAFIVYPFVVLCWAAIAWWSLVRAHALYSALVAIVLFVLGSVIHSALIARWPFLKQMMGEPMGETLHFLTYGCASVGTLAIITFLCAVIAAPSQMHRQQREQIAALSSNPHLDSAAIREELTNMRREADKLLNEKVVDFEYHQWRGRVGTWITTTHARILEIFDQADAMGFEDAEPWPTPISGGPLPNTDQEKWVYKLAGHKRWLEIRLSDLTQTNLRLRLGQKT